MTTPATAHPRRALSIGMAALLVVIALVGVVCTHAVLVTKPSRPETICVVLSVGAQKGLAHLGALDALKNAAVKIDYVYGNSMGALVGSLYASAPKDDLTARYRGLMAAYQTKSNWVAGGRGLVGGLLGFGLALASGGSLGVAGLAAGGGVLLGAGTTKKLDDGRLEEVMDTYYHHAQIETLPIPFATAYQMANDSGLDSVVATKGTLAQAVARSVNNPLIFKDTDLTYLDHGADRAAAVPIEDACKLFHPTKIIAINVSGQPSYYRPIDCDVQEVVVPTGTVDPEVFSGQGEGFTRIYLAGYNATMNKLGIHSGPPLPGSGGDSK